MLDSDPISNLFLHFLLSTPLSLKNACTQPGIRYCSSVNSQMRYPSFYGLSALMVFGVSLYLFRIIRLLSCVPLPLILILLLS